MESDIPVYPQRFLSTSHPASPSSTHEAFRSFHHLCSYTVSFQDLVCKRGGAKPFRAIFSLRDINDDSPEAEAEAEAGLGVGLGLHNIDINSNDEQEEKLRINDSIRDNNRISIEGKVYAHKAFSNTYNHYSKGRYGTTIIDQELAFVIYGYVKGIKKDVVMMNVSKVQAGLNASALNPIKGKHVNAYPSYALSTGANYIISFYASSQYHSRQQHNTLIRYLHTMTDMEALQVMIAPQIRGQLPTTPTHAPAIPMIKQEPIEEEPITPRSTRRSHVRSASSPLVFTGTSSAVTSVLASASLASAAVSTSQSVSVSCGLGLYVNVNAPMCSSPISGHHSRSHSYHADSPRTKRSSSKRRYDQPITTSVTSTSPSTDDSNMATTPRQLQSQHPINPHNALGSTSPTSAAAPAPTSVPSSHPQLRLSHSSSSLPHAMSLLQQQRPLQLGIGNKAVEDALHKRRRRHSKMHPSTPVVVNPHIHIPNAAQHHHQQQHHHDASTVLHSPASYLSSSFRGLNLNVPTTFSLGSPNASHKSSASSSPSRTSALTISLASASLAKYINSNEYHEITPHSGSSSMISSPRESRSGSLSTYHEYSSMASSNNMDNDDIDSVYTEDDTLSSFSTTSPSSVDELDQHATSWPEVTTNFTINLKGLDKITHEPTRSDYQDPILSSLSSVSTSTSTSTSMDTSSSSSSDYGYGYGYAGIALRTQHGGMDPLAYHNHSSALLFDRYNEEFSC